MGWVRCLAWGGVRRGASVELLSHREDHHDTSTWSRSSRCQWTWLAGWCRGAGNCVPRHARTGRNSASIGGCCTDC
eukprot:1720442-Rhodomonas_salina.1